MKRGTADRRLALLATYVAAGFRIGGYFLEAIIKPMTVNTIIRI